MPRPLPTDLSDEIVRYIRSGLSTHAIVGYTGVSHRQVTRIHRRLDKYGSIGQIPTSSPPRRVRHPLDFSPRMRQRRYLHKQ